jgi:predicted nucleic acid-binding protein
MLAYLDTSVVVSKILGQQPDFKEWRQIKRAVSSQLLRVECLRAIQRVCASQRVSPERQVAWVRDTEEVLGAISLLKLDDFILARSAQPLSLPLRTLDAIHLVSALTYQEELGGGESLVFCSHDAELRAAAGLYGLRTAGGA